MHAVVSRPARLRRSSTRSLLVTAAVVAVGVTVSGCSALLGPAEPVRDDETGEITEASEADVLALRVGDCLGPNDLEGDIESVATTPCSEPHGQEIYASTVLPEGDYPEDIEALADDFCMGEFEGFVGLSYEESELYLAPMYPLQAGWESLDDREVLCLISAEEDVTGTLKGAAR